MRPRPPHRYAIAWILLLLAAPLHAQTTQAVTLTAPAAKGLMLKTVRNMVGLTQAELARRSTVSATTISRIERGLTDPDTATIRRLRDAIRPRLDSIIPSAAERWWLAASGGIYVRCP